jgi:hypothetical protein
VVLAGTALVVGVRLPQVNRSVASEPGA